MNLKNNNGDVICEGDSIREIVINNKENLRFADLTAADLRFADLNSADLNFIKMGD